MKSVTTIVVGVIALCTVTLAAIVGISLAGNSDTTPLITAIIGFIAPTLLGIFALAKIDNVQSDVTTTKNHIENGLIDQKVQQALDERPGENPIGGVK